MCILCVYGVCARVCDDAASTRQLPQTKYDKTGVDHTNPLTASYIYAILRSTAGSRAGDPECTTLWRCLHI